MRGVDVDDTEQRQRTYELDKRRDGLSKHVKEHWGWFVVGGIFAWALWVGCQVLWKTWLNVDDPWATARMVNEKISTVVPGFSVGGLSLLFFDFVTNGNLIKGILNGNRACAVFASVVFMGPIFLYLRIIL